MFTYIFSFEIFYLFLAEIDLRTTHALLRWKLGCSLVCLQMECQDWSAEYFVFWKGSIFKGFLNASSKTGRIGQRSSGKNGESTCFCIPLWGAIRLSFAVSVSAFKVWLVAIDFHVSIYKSRLMCILWICICLVYIHKYIYIIHTYIYIYRQKYTILIALCWGRFRSVVHSCLFQDSESTGGKRGRKLQNRCHRWGDATHDHSKICPGASAEGLTRISWSCYKSTWSS